MCFVLPNRKRNRIVFPVCTARFVPFSCIKFENKAPPMAKAGSVWATVLLPALFVLAACGQDNRYAAPPPQKVPVAHPVEQAVSEYFESTGNAAAINTVDLVARVQGFVQAIRYAD